jgi:hypothetical protein
MLLADLRHARRADHLGQRVHDRVEDGHAGHVQLLAALLQDLAQVRRDQGEDHHARQHADDGEHLLQLGPGPHEEPDMLDRDDVLELGHSRARDGGDRLAGAVRDQMQVQTHDALPAFELVEKRWTVFLAGRAPLPSPTIKPSIHRTQEIRHPWGRLRGPSLAQPR